MPVPGKTNTDHLMTRFRAALVLAQTMPSSLKRYRHSEEACNWKQLIALCFKTFDVFRQRKFSTLINVLHAEQFRNPGSIRGNFID